MASQLPTLHLTCFGPPTAILNGRAPPREVLWQKHLGLLIYLALSPDRRRTRSHLVGMFWPEVPEQRARKALNEAVLRLRKSIGNARLRTEGEALRLEGEGLEVDAIRFSTAATRAPAEAASLLRGDFLEGFSVDDAPGFEEWARVEAERYRALAASVLVGLGERLLAASRFTEAADAARRALIFAPYSEPAIRIGIRALALSGDPGSAHAQLKRFIEQLQRELGERPSAGLTALAERIRRQQTGADARRGEAPPALVGRESVYREAFQTVAHGLTSGPRALFITATPGMGRSRIVAETLERATLDGALGVLARPLETDHDAPWSTLRLLLRGGLTDAPGLPAARPEALSAIAGVLPEWTDRFRPRAVSDVADMASALSSVLGSIADERPLAIALDDAHWADGSSLAALAAAVAQLKSARLAVIISAAHGAGDSPRELLSFQGEVGRALAGVTVRLDPLTEADVGALVRLLAPWCRDEADADRLKRRLTFETRGNPFFIVTLLHALGRATTLRSDLAAWPPAQATLDASLPFSIPSLVRSAIAFRLADLSRDEQAALGAASVLGEVLDLDLMSFVLERARAEIERALPEFERRTLVAFDGQRYVFVAPLVAEVVRAECVPHGERRRLERRALEALAPRTDLESRALRADLLARAEPGTAAVEFAIAVTREALEARAVRLARRAFAAAQRACRAANTDPAPLEALRSRL